MVIEIENIFKDYSNSFSHFKLEIPKIQFETGIVTFLMGHNGSGKSVFFKILSDEIQNDKKLKISINGNSTKIKGFGKILRQKAIENLALELTVKENFIIHFQTKKLIEKILPSILLKNYISDKLSSSKFLKEKENQLVSELSGGQQQTLAFFITASSKSKMLLLDEFLAATDMNTTETLLRESKKYAKENDASVVIVSHDIDVALDNADRIFVFSNGQLKHELKKGSSEWEKENLKRLLKQ